MSDPDLIYLLKRAAEERARAAQSADGARHAHEEMAKSYAKRASFMMPADSPEPAADR